MEIKETIAKNIKTLRAEKGLTQKQLSEELGISYKSIINYENAYREPKTDIIYKLSQFFEVSPAFLRGETDVRDLMSWDDQEIMNAIKDNLPEQLSDLATHIFQQSKKNQKLIFDILVEIKSILNINDTKEKDFYIDLVHENIVTITTVRSRAKNKNFTTTK